MNIKQEEIVPLADMLLVSFERDQKEMEEENSFYSASFLASFKAYTEEVRELEKADVLLVNQKNITTEMYLIADSLKQPLKLFNIVIQKAALPTKLVNDIIASINKRNMEAVLSNIKALTQVINNNKDLLQSKAMKATLPVQLDLAFSELTIKSNLQTTLKNERKQLTDDNHGSYEVLYSTYILDICKMGKAVYHTKAKSSEYTIYKMLKNLHITRNNKGNNGGNSPKL
jgi:hypothetical protein